MIPLCTTTISPLQSRCGCAFSSVGRPCVAQRVWPIPYTPSSGVMRIDSSRLRSLPGERRTSSLPFSPTTAMPAESEPRYSRRRRPSRIRGTTRLGPTYPTIPHIVAISGCAVALERPGPADPTMVAQAAARAGGGPSRPVSSRHGADDEVVLVPARGCAVGLVRQHECLNQLDLAVIDLEHLVQDVVAGICDGGRCSHFFAVAKPGLAAGDIENDLCDHQP